MSAPAWAAPGAEEGTAGARQPSARPVGSMALLDLTVHPWDPAGDDEAASAVVVAELTRAVAEPAPTTRATGMAGEPVQVAEGAPVFERLLARTGRDPRRPSPAGSRAEAWTEAE
ncbi:hypothetical protein ACWCPM_19895 [Streptomyces sp. NPDC002309]